MAAANHLPAGDLAASLPGWLNRRIWNHNHNPRDPAATTALHQLAAITGTPGPTLARALPVFGGGPASPARATLACRRCTATRGIYRLVPVHLPAWQQICTRHGIWLANPGQPQLDITTCPAIITAQHHARRLLRHHAPQQLLLTLATATTQPASQARHLPLLTAGNPRMNDPAAHRELALAAAYPHLIELAASALTSLQTEPTPNTHNGRIN